MRSRAGTTSFSIILFAALIVLAPFLFNFILLQFYVRESGLLLALGMVGGLVAVVAMSRSSR